MTSAASPKAISPVRSFAVSRLTPVAVLLALACAASALPREVVVESASTKVIVNLSNGRAVLKSISGVETVTFAADSADFAITTDKGRFTRADLKVTDVVTDDTGTYVVMDGAAIGVTERYRVWPSGCVKRSFQIFAKERVFVENVKVLELRVNEQPAQSLFHQGRFLQYGKGGLLVRFEMPIPAGEVRFTGERLLWASYEPVRQLDAGESFETVPAVFLAWSGDIQAGYDAARSLSNEQSGWRKYATVRTSSESPAALTTAYDGYKAIDDDPTTRWRTEKKLDGIHWIEIEFPKPVRFDTMIMMLDNEEHRPVLEKPTPLEEYRLQVWGDQGWRDVASGTRPPKEPVKFAEVIAGKVRLLITGCYGRFSLFDFKLYRDPGVEQVIRENLCSRFWVDEGVRMPFTYFNTWYVRHPRAGYYYRARGLLTYDMVLPLIPMAAECGMDNFVLDSGWKYKWYGIGYNPQWPIEFPEGERPFTEAADEAGIRLAGWFNFFWLEGESRDHQWRVMGSDGKMRAQMCLLSDYYDFVKNEMLWQIRNSHMKTMKIDGFVPPDWCYATNHNHKPGNLRDAGWLAFMQLAEELKRQYPDFLLGVYTWDPFWLKYSEIVHTFEDHGGLSPGALAPTRSKMQFMHDREMFNEGYWRYLVTNQIEGSAIITVTGPEFREELIGNLAGPIRRQISTNLAEFSAEDRRWIGQCINWSRVNARFLEQCRPFFANPAVREPWELERDKSLRNHLGADVLESNTLEGYAHVAGDEGYIFIFNPTFHGADFTIPVSKELGFTPKAAGLTFQVIYPYIETIGSGVSHGGAVKGYLPAEKYVIIRARKEPIPLLAGDCRCAVRETIWNRAELELRATPTAAGGKIKTKLALPKDAVIDEVRANGKPVTPSADGSYEIALTVPVIGALSAQARPVSTTNGRKTLTARVKLTGELSDPSLMLFLVRPLPGPRQRMPNAEPGELGFRLLVGGKPLEGKLGDTLEKDWESEQGAGWWLFDLPNELDEFDLSLECSEKVKPMLVLSAIQEAHEVQVICEYSRTKPGSNVTVADPEAFLHGAFPAEREYFTIFEPQMQ